MGDFDRISYNDKKKELVNFIFNCINDTMQENFSMRYRTIATREEAQSLFGNASILEVQLYYVEELRTLYIYYVLDKNNRFGRVVDAPKMYIKINKCIKDRAFSEEAINVEFLGPCKQYDEDFHECSSDVCDNVNSLVFTYWIWRGLDNVYRPEFITDKRYILLDYKANPMTDIKEFNRQAELINSRYDTKYNRNLIITAFDEYNALYQETFNKSLTPAGDNIEHMFLLNETDYSIIE